MKIKARARGRPKDARADEAILRATDRLLAKNGYKATTVNAIAAVAGVAKATIYRRWKDKASVVIDAVRATSNLGRPVADTGSIISDLRRHLYGFIRMLRGPAGSKLKAMFSEAQNDPSLAKAFREKIWLPGRLITIAALECGIARGELRKDVNLPALSDAIYGAIYYRLLLEHDALDKTFINNLLNAIFAGAQGFGPHLCTQFPGDDIAREFVENRGQV